MPWSCAKPDLLQYRLAFTSVEYGGFKLDV